MAEISPIEHAVMWIGVYEFQHCLDVPWRVVLNECIELAKEFGGTDGHKYVNARAQRPGAAAARRRSRGRPRPAGKAPRHEDLAARRAHRAVLRDGGGQGRVASWRARWPHTDRPMIFLNIGEPDFTAPPLVQEAAARAIRDGATQYTAGHWACEPLRERISGWYAQRFGVDVPARRIVVTAGASAALQLACLALIDAGDEILMPDPSYPCNRHFVSAAEGTAGAGARPPPPSASSSAPPRSRPPGATRTRGVLLASPSNPTGTSIAPDELRRIHEVVRGRGGITLVDEIYLGLSYDDTFGHTALAHRRPGHQHQQLLQVLQHDRLAAGLDGGARRAGAGDRAPGAEPVHLPQHGGAARGAGLLRAREHRRVRTPPRRVQGPARLLHSRARRAGPDGAGDARRRLLRLGRLHATLARKLGVTGSWDFAFEVMKRAHVAVTPGRDFGTRRDRALRPLFHRQLDGAAAGSGRAAARLLADGRRPHELSHCRCASTGKTPTPAASCSMPTT